MRYIVTGNSDVGKVKKVNQDSFCVKIADTGKGKAVFAVLCDGMGGFEQGELASATVVKAYVKWFEESFLENITLMDYMRIKWDWERLAYRLNEAISAYGTTNNIKIGTTATVFLIYCDQFYVMNVGDCRLYRLAENIEQITNDHSWVALQVELGNMTKEEARLDKRNNKLLQCIGAMWEVKPDFFTGNVVEDNVFMMCCDGVRNKVNDEELFYFLHPSCLVDEKIMNNNMLYLFELNKLRDERDNMTIILIRAVESTMIIHDDETDFVIEKEITFMESKKYLEI